jgi:hypothetical protein
MIKNLVLIFNKETQSRWPKEVQYQVSHNSELHAVDWTTSIAAQQAMKTPHSAVLGRVLKKF